MQINKSTNVARPMRRVQERSIDFTAPPGWSGTQSEHCILVEIDADSPEFVRVQDRMHETMPSARLIRVERVQNLLLWDYYCLRKARMQKLNGSSAVLEASVWHGTRSLDPAVIYRDKQDGFMMQHSAEGMWGRGLYFAENAKYSNMYCHNNNGTLPVSFR